MHGIVSYGIYLPRLRLPRQTIARAMAWYNPATLGLAAGERTVANYDEDSLTMAVGAAMDSLRGRSVKNLGALFLASTSHPYGERQNAGIAAAALDLPPATRTADFTGSLKCGASALLAGLDAVQAGSVKTALVCAGECRLGRPGSVQEHYFGDGAAALLLGQENVIAEFQGSFSLTQDFADVQRPAGSEFPRSWEERWSRDEGYAQIIPAAIGGLCQKYGLRPTDFAKVVYPCQFERDHAAIAKRLELGPGKAQTTFFQQIGDCGAAQPLIMLAAALDESKPGDKILVAGYGQGIDAAYFQVTPEIEKQRAILRPMKKALEHRAELPSYEKYLVFRHLLPVDLGIRGEIQAPTALTVLWRHRAEVFALSGTRCTACGLPQYPAQRICANPECRVQDQMEPYRFAGRDGKIFTFTGDNLAFSFDPPAIYGLVDLDGGGRLLLDFTDCDVKSLKVGQPVETSFRRKYHDTERGLFGYFWKAVPARGLA